MSTQHKRKTGNLYLQEYLPPVIKHTNTENNGEIAQNIIADINTEKKPLREYIPPTIDVILVEMENGIAANSGFALPIKANAPVNETWNNADINPEQPIYW